MNRQTLHEYLHQDLSKVVDTPIAILGCGAIGSNLALSLARRGFRHFRLLDKDRVESHNISTQVWNEDDVGTLKVSALIDRLLGINGSILVTSAQEDILQERRLPSSVLFIDSFDNKEARQRAIELAPYEYLLHCGMSENSGMVEWHSKKYKVPEDRDLIDPCAYPLSRTLVELTVIAASEAITKFLLGGDKINYLVLGGELAIRSI